MKSSMPLRLYLSLQFAAVALLPVVFIAVLVWLLLMPQFRDRIAIQHASLASTVAGQLSAHLTGGQRQLSALADFVENGELTTPAQLVDLLDAQCGRGALFETIYIVDNDDSVIQSVGLALSRRFAREDLLGMDLSGLQALTKARHMAESTWSETFLSTVSSRLAVALNIPLAYRDIVGEITVDRLSEFISMLPIKGHFQVLVLDRKGRIVADSQRRRGGQQLDLNRLPVAVDRQRIVNESVPFELDGQSLLGTVVAIPELGWTVMVAQPFQSAFKPLRDTMVIIVIVLAVALLLALSVAWLQAGDLSRVFRVYGRQAREIAKGQYGLQRPVTSIAEFRTLADNLQRMAEKVQQRENQLRESEARLRVTQFSFDRASIGIFRLGDDACILEANEAFGHMLGYTTEELAGMTIFDIDTKVKRQEWERIWNRLKELQSYIFESGYRCRDGRIIPMEIYSNLLDYDGRQYSIVFCRDITERRQADNELRRLRNYLVNIINSMPSVLVGVDQQGRVTQWNHQAEQETGLSFDKARFQPLESVFPRLADEMAAIRSAIHERKVLRNLKVPHQTNGEVRYEDVTIFPLVANGVEGAVIRLDDVTERVRLEELMVQSEKMLSVGGLAAGMAHEINNPLAGILQNCAVLENRLTADLPANLRAAEAAGTTMDALRQYHTLRKLPGMLGNIRKSGSMAAAIVKNMLSFARKSEKGGTTHDLGSLLDQAIDLLKTDYDMKTHYDFKQIEIQREYEQPPPLVTCEGSKLQQVFMNILKNGAEAMAGVQAPNHALRFVLRVKKADPWVQVEIEDNGPGMEEVVRRRIFEPFYTTKGVGKGTGLGMSVSYFIVTESHGGEMDVVAAKGGGSTFIIRLPLQGPSSSAEGAWPAV